MTKIIYVSSAELHRSLDQIEKIRHRSTLVDGLISAYNLTKNCNFHLKKPSMATDDDLASAHDRDYLAFLSFIGENLDDEDSYRDQMDLFNLGYECPPFEQLSSFCLFFSRRQKENRKSDQIIASFLGKSIGGASISAAQSLHHEKSTIAMNFFGGWHHASPINEYFFLFISFRFVSF